MHLADAMEAGIVLPRQPRPNLVSLKRRKWAYKELVKCLLVGLALMLTACGGGASIPAPPDTSAAPAVQAPAVQAAPQTLLSLSGSGTKGFHSN